MIQSETLEARKKELQSQITALEKKESELRNLDSFKLLTNTAYIQNMKLFDGWTDFKEFIELKHEMSWKNLNSSTVEVTFRVLPLKEEGFKNKK